MRLPLAAVRSAPGETPQIDPKAPSMQGDAPDLAGVLVLVIEDESDARDLIRRVLEESNAHVLLASSAEQALATLEMECPQVILSDIGMPEQDGYSLMQAIRRRGIRVPAAALTAFASCEDRTRALQAGYQTHLAKPVAPAELLAAVAALAQKAAITGGERS